METIRNEPNSLCNKIYLPYRVTLNSLFTEEEIAVQKKSHSFKQEYELQYSAGICNIIDVAEIDNCIEEYQLNEAPSQLFTYYELADPGCGIDSKFAIVITQWKDGRMYVVHHESHKNPLYVEMLKTINKHNSF